MPTTHPDIVCFGELLVDLIGDRPATLRTAEQFAKRPGGAPANVAVGCARLGADTSLISAVGNDQFGDFLVEHVADQGVDTGHIQRSPRRTTLAFAALDEDAVPHFMFYRDNCADLDIRYDAVETDAVHHTDIFHFGSLSLADDPVCSTLMRILGDLPDTVTVSCDPNIRPDLWGPDLHARFEDALQHVDFLKLSEDELVELSDEDSREEQVTDLVERFGLSEVLVTRGVAGAELYTEDGRVAVPALDADVVDTTGAGDAIVAGYLTAMLDGKEPRERLEQASAVAACCIERTGAMTALPERETVRSRLQRQHV